MNLATILNYVLAVFTVVGAWASIHYGRKSARLAAERKRFDWGDLQTAARDLARSIMKTYTPEVAFTLTARGATVAQFVLNSLGEHIPLYVGIQEDLRGRRFVSPPKGYEAVTTSKWNNFIPQSLLLERGRKLLIIDDFAMSGDSLVRVRDFLVFKGFSGCDVKTATFVCTETAIAGGKAPDFYAFKTPGPDFYFPWGKAT